MRATSPARLLRIHLSEGDRHQGRPLYEAIVERCREMKIAGATVFRGLEGYGESAHLHRPHLGRHEQPILIVVVDTAESVERLVPVIEGMMTTGLMAVSEVETLRLQKAGSTSDNG